MWCSSERISIKCLKTTILIQFLQYKRCRSTYTICSMMKNNKLWIYCDCGLEKYAISSHKLCNAYVYGKEFLMLIIASLWVFGCLWTTNKRHGEPTNCFFSTLQNLQCKKELLYRLVYHKLFYVNLSSPAKAIDAHISVIFQTVDHPQARWDVVTS